MKNIKGNKSKWYSLPILWLYLGPPILRLEERGAMASLNGSIDFWNFFRIVFWLFWGYRALRSIRYINFESPGLIKLTGKINIWIIVFLLSLFISTLVSPAPLFTFSNSIFMLILVLASIDLGLKIFLEHIEVEEVLFGLLSFSSILLLLGGLVLVISPNLIILGMTKFGPRLAGGSLLSIPDVAMIQIFLGLYFFIFKINKFRWLYFFFTSLGFVAIALSQTRSYYVGLSFGFFIFIIQWPQFLNKKLHYLIRASNFLSIVFIVILLVFSYNTKQYLKNYLIRDKSSLYTMSGRTGINKIVFRGSLNKPLGMGYGAGPRVYIQSQARALKKYVIAERIGSTHNSYLEIFAGTGFLGIISFIFIIFTLITRIAKFSNNTKLPLNALLFSLLIAGFASSGLTLPFRQASALFWLILGICNGLFLKSKSNKYNISLH